jgi:hypothetical protein
MTMYDDILTLEPYYQAEKFLLALYLVEVP